jgi:hypothetical protein
MSVHKYRHTHIHTHKHHHYQIKGPVRTVPERGSGCPGCPGWRHTHTHTHKHTHTLSHTCKNCSEERFRMSRIKLSGFTPFLFCRWIIIDTNIYAGADMLDIMLLSALLYVLVCRLIPVRVLCCVWIIVHIILKIPVLQTVPKSDGLVS